MGDSYSEYPPLKLIPENMPTATNRSEAIHRKTPSEAIDGFPERGDQSAKKDHDGHHNQNQKNSEGSEMNISEYAELQRDVEYTNRILAGRGKAVHLRLHHHGNHTILQTVDRRGGKTARHFREITREMLAKILQDLLEESGILLDATA